jgi:formamidopyrimidine-DNA glycosylase
LAKRKLVEMPELPDIAVYVDCIDRKAGGQKVSKARKANPFLVRSVDPPVGSIEGKTFRSASRLGKRIVLEFSGETFLVIHLMIAGRLHWKDPGAPLKGKQNLAALDFPEGSLILTEAGSKRRASFHLVSGKGALHEFDPGGIDVMGCDAKTFIAQLTASNHTVKRALTDPRICSGVGNAYSDEILHRAKVSPLLWTSRATKEELNRLFECAQSVLEEWRARLSDEAAANGGWPKNVTAFRRKMSVHGRFGEPCPVCTSPVQRIAYADNETNYCPTCQTQGVLLADRSLSRLLKKDWPRTLDELEDLKRTTRT